MRITASRFVVLLGVIAACIGACDLLESDAPILISEPIKQSVPCEEYFAMKQAGAELTIDGAERYYNVTVDDLSEIGIDAPGPYYLLEFIVKLYDILRDEPVSGVAVSYRGMISTTDTHGVVTFAPRVSVTECLPLSRIVDDPLPTGLIYMIPRVEIMSDAEIYEKDLWRFTSLIASGHSDTISHHFDRPHPTLFADPSERIKIFISSNPVSWRDDGLWPDSVRAAYYEGVFGSYEIGDQVTPLLDLPQDAYLELGLEDALGSDLFERTGDSLSADIRVISSDPWGGGSGFSNFTHRLIAQSRIHGFSGIGVGRHELMHHVTRAFNSGHSKDGAHIIAPGGAHEPGAWSRDDLLATKIMLHPINLTHYSR
jgi:hypothetical protein